MKHLKLVSIVYVALPNLVFLLTWFDPLKIFLSLSSLVIILFIIGKDILKSKALIATVPTVYMFVLPLLALIFCYLFGFGEFNQQSLDWGTNNFKFYDLITYPAPVYYQQEDTYLCYYIGYYIVPAYVSKLIGIVYAKYVVLGWTWLGIALVLFWLYSVIKIKFILFIFFDGAIGICKYIIFSFSGLQEYIDRFGFIKSGDTFLFLLAPFYTSLYWATQHALIALIGSLLIIDDSKKQRDIQIDAFFVACCLLWSPICTIGLLPFFFQKYFNTFDKIYLLFDRRMIFYFLLIVSAFLPIILYLGSNRGASGSSNGGLLWTTSNLWYVSYVIFVFFYVLVWLPFIIKNKIYTPNFFISIAIILISPFFVLGKYNDFLARVSMPAHVVFALHIISAFRRNSYEGKLYYQTAYGILGIISSVMIWKDAVKSLLFPSKPLNTISAPYRANAKNTLQFLANVYGKETVQNYQLRQSGYIYYILKDNNENNTKKTSK